MGNITRKRHLVVGIALVAGLAACSGSGTSPQPNTTSNLPANVLQLAVGTANLFGDQTGSALAGLNVVATYRQPKGAFHVGDSAVFVNTPTLSGPFALPAAAGTADGFFSTIETGPGPTEIGKSSMTGTAQTATNATTFGISGGVFGLGIEPYNYNGGGTPDVVGPYTQPLYDTNTTDPNNFVPWGGPPAFDPNKDGLGVRDGNLYPGGTLGISEGLDIFEIAPVAGTYTLGVSVPANTGAFTASANASLTSTILLPAISPGVPTLDGNGGGSFAVTLPAGVTEAYLQIVDGGPDPTSMTPPASCNGSSVGLPTYYTVEVTATESVTLPDSSGPGTPGNGTPSICTSAQNSKADGATTDGDSFLVQSIGFDYPAYEASYPNSLGNPAPKLSGANGQADITISSVAGYYQPSTGGIVKFKAIPRSHPLVRR
ncbi:MAG: hypothetical protein ACREM8_00940 [Vulcanimicrobiaceae bacterium]